MRSEVASVCARAPPTSASPSSQRPRPLKAVQRRRRDMGERRCARRGRARRSPRRSPGRRARHGQRGGDASGPWIELLAGVDHLVPSLDQPVAGTQSTSSEHVKRSEQISLLRAPGECFKFGPSALDASHVTRRVHSPKALTRRERVLLLGRGGLGPGGRATARPHQDGPRRSPASASASSSPDSRPRSRSSPSPTAADRRCARADGPFVRATARACNWLRVLH